MKSGNSTNTAEAFITANDIGTAMTTLRGKETQKECAQRSGLDRPGWNQYEKGKRFPKPGTVERIAQGLGVEVVELTEAVIWAWSNRMNREFRRGKEREKQSYTFTMTGRIDLTEDAGSEQDFTL